MRNKLFLLLLIFPLAQCSAGTAVTIETSSNTTKLTAPISTGSFADTTDYIRLFRQVDSTKTYSQTKAEVLKTKSKIAADQITEDSLSALFTNLLVQKIIPYWYGTPWDFNGYTAVPNQGVIACGYFVSTTLLHMGVNVNRYKLAQQLPIHEAQSLACGEPVMEVYNETVEENINELDSILQEGIYFLGMDGSHVGFILKHQGQLFVIHANYIGDGGVAIEKPAESLAFCSYRRFYVAPISRNATLMSKWIKNEFVAVIEN